MSDEASCRRRKRYLRPAACLRMQRNLLDEHYYKHVHKTRVFDSTFIGSRWMDSILNSKTETWCVNAFRMEWRVFKQLCNDLTDKYGLQGSPRMQVVEKVGIFLYTVAQGLSYRNVGKRFQRSTAKVSIVIHDVLSALVGREDGFNGMAKYIIKPSDPSFTQVPTHISNDSRYNPFFLGAIGCIDGTHINACIPETDQIAYRGRKGICTFNVMAVCDFDMLFTFMSVGRDQHMMRRCLSMRLQPPSMEFPHSLAGRYYLVGKGYPNKEDYMVPYSRARYHLSQFENVEPGNSKEAFKKLHSSPRSCIERSFGVLKACWKILRVMPAYHVDTQVDIILACFALHNYVIKARNEPSGSNGLEDVIYEDEDEYEDEVDDQQINDNDNPSESDGDDGDDEEDDTSLGGETKHIRDQIAKMIWERKA